MFFKKAVKINYLESHCKFLEEWSNEVIKDNVILAAQVEHALDHLEWLKEVPCISALLGEYESDCGCPRCSAARTYFVILVDGMMRQYIGEDVGDREWEDVYADAMVKGLKGEKQYRSEDE